MDRIEWMREFIKRFDEGKVDAAEFVDNCNETIDAFKELIHIYNLKEFNENH